MKKNLFCFAVPFFFVLTASAQQRYDNTWAMGYNHFQLSSIPNVYFGGMFMDFSYTPPAFTSYSVEVDDILASICNEQGVILAYTDGCAVYNRNHIIMPHGDTISPGKVYKRFCKEGSAYPTFQGVLFLPPFNGDGKYYLIHLRKDNYYWNGMNLMYTVIDAAGDNGNGAVLQKGVSVLSDSIELGDYVTATRHANGRDWWVVAPRNYYSEYHVSLLTPAGLQYVGLQAIGPAQIDSTYSIGQTAFSPDGSKYVHNSLSGLHIMDFDRCTGTFSNSVYLEYTDTYSSAGGAAVSPNSRYLYIPTGGQVHQYDLWADSVLATRQVVAYYDGYYSPFATNFFQAANGPDGKIYIVSSHNNDILHVIHQPNQPGLACNLEQHGVKLPSVNSYFALNIPHYRLGPLDGTSCDTLGLDNHPLAGWRYDLEDTLAPLQVTFTDVSNYEPATWHWDFAGLAMSSDTNPVFTFPAPGVYKVCLTVCNAYSCDTLCRDVPVGGVSAVGEVEGGLAGLFRVSPNPTMGDTWVRTDYAAPYSVEVLDPLGRSVSRIGLPGGAARLSLSGLPAGLYWLRFWGAGKVLGVEKVVVVK